MSKKGDPTDLEILEYEQSIKDEEARKNPLVMSEPQSTEVLGEEYQHNSAFISKLEKLKSDGYQFFRRCRGDGNCFYRALAFSFFEQLILWGKSNLELYDYYINISTNIHLAQLEQSGFQKDAIIYFYEEFQELLTQLRQIHAEAKHDSQTEVRQEIQKDMIVKTMQDPMKSNAIVVHLRFLASAFLKIHSQEYEPFLLSTNEAYLETMGVPDMATFCRSNIEAMDKEADEIVVTALANILDVVIHLVYLDSHGESPTFHLFQSDSTPPECGRVHVWLLYRPGHYDIMYNKSILSLNS